MITLRHTTLSRTPLDSDQPHAEISNRQQTALKRTNIHAPGGIRTHNPSRRAVADLRHRPRGCWDRLRLLYLGTDIMHSPGPDFAADRKMRNYFSRVLFDTRECFCCEVNKSPIYLIKHRFWILIDIVYHIVYLQVHIFCKSAFLYRRNDAEWESFLLSTEPFFVIYVTGIWHWDIWEREAPNFSCSNAPNRLIKHTE